MIVRAIEKKPIEPDPIRGQSLGNRLVPVRCLPGGEVMVHQVNQPGTVGDGVNRKNKDGVLILGDDGQYLRNVRVHPDGAQVVRVVDPVDVNMPVVEVRGAVKVLNYPTQKPVMVSNMPESIRIQEPLRVMQEPIEAKMAPINFDGHECTILYEPCKVYSIFLTVYDATWVEIPGVTGPMFTKEFKIDLFPLFIRLGELTIGTKEWSRVGGYVIYEV